MEILQAPHIRQTIATDVDDVAVQHAIGFIEWSNSRYGTSLTLADYSEAWHELWDVDHTETDRRKAEFFVPEIIGSFLPIHDAGVGLTALSESFDLVAVTARRQNLQRITETALEIIAPGAISRVICATTLHPDGRKTFRPKPVICQEIGADYLVDDQPKHCIAAAAEGISAVLFGDYAWSTLDPEAPPNIAIAHSWQDVTPHFDIPWPATSGPAVHLL